MRSSTPKQALAKKETDQGRSSIGLKKTDHGNYKFYSEGGSMKTTKATEMKHAMAMKKAGVPKKFVKQEMAEAKTMKYAKGGGIESKGKTKGTMASMRGGGKC
jgi:hypothetical protein